MLAVESSEERSDPQRSETTRSAVKKINVLSPEASITSKYMSKTNFVIAIFLTAWFAWWFWHPTNLHSADLGRHLMNGQIIVTSFASPKLATSEGWAEAWKVLHTNYYSYTTPNASFINHHWLTGVIFYIVWYYGGFVGLGLLSAFVNTAAFILYFRLGIKRGGFFTASLVAAALIPLIAERTEIRPEMFTYLLGGLFLTILVGVFEGTLKPKKLWWLLPLQLFWINLHIYFFLGFVFIALYWAASLIKKNNLSPAYFLTGVGATLAALCNPSFIKGLFYPFFIFSNYAIKTFENQSIFGLDSLGKTHPNFLLLQLGAAILLVSYTNLILRNHKAIRLPEIFLSMVSGIWAYSAIRNLSLFGFVALFAAPGALASAFPDLFPKENSLIRRVGGVLLFTVLVASISFSRLEYLAPRTSLGILPGNTTAADFINTNQLTGPMFNDFDIGSYAIFFLYPRLRPFMDNRPEAFPKKFINEVYSPMLLQDSAWQEQLQKYNFNFILYHFTFSEKIKDKFLIARLHDPTWVPVFADEFSIVLVRRNPINQPLISAHEMPLSSFRF